MQVIADGSADVEESQPRCVANRIFKDALNLIPNLTIQIFAGRPDENMSAT